MKTERRLPVLSLVVMNNAGEVADFRSAVGEDARFELSYTMPEGFVDEIAPLVAGKVTSIHACCPATANFPNFASSDPRVIEESFRNMDATLETALRFGAAIVVLHSGYATDEAMPSEYAKRKTLLARKEFTDDVRFADGAICGPGYNTTEKYLRFAERTKENLANLAERYGKRGVRLAVENLNPRVGYLFHTPGEMVSLAAVHPNLGLCLDLGHLFISSFVYGFDFLDGIGRIAATGKTITCHLHSNTSGPGRFRDDHQSIDKNGFPLAAAMDILCRTDAQMVLELLEEPLRNYRLLRGILEAR